VTGGRGGDTGWLVALCVARAGASVMSMAFPTVLAAVQTEWGLSNRAAGSISSASQAGTALSLVVLSAMADYWGPRAVFLVSSAVAAVVALVLPLLAQGQASAIPLFFVMGVLSNGEEIGWRGYATPRLQAGHSALTAALVVGMIWALWHIPKALTAGSGQDYPFWLFVLDTVAKAIVFAWVYNGTGGSLWAVTLLHASVNTSVVFLPILRGAPDAVRLIAISIGLHCLVAIAVVLATGTALGARSRGTPPAAVGSPSATPA